MTPSKDRAAVLDWIALLFRTAGASRYDEAVSQLEHALQSAELAAAEDAGDALITAALLHDIGHLVLDEHSEDDAFLDADLHHEAVAARILRRWFGPQVWRPVALHVRAKRYLVAADPGYADQLSPASTRSLRLQGGPLRGEEVEQFARLPGAAEAVRLRRWDDGAKVPGAHTGDLADFLPAVARQLASAQPEQSQDEHLPHPSPHGLSPRRHDEPAAGW